MADAPINPMPTGRPGAGSPDLSRAAQQYRSGYTLPQYLYTSDEAFRVDVDYIAEHLWVCVGHESELSSPGCWFLFEIANESIIVNRDNEGRVRAFYNVCPHRGSAICLENKGQSKRFVCPYHAWTFTLEGKLRGAADMPSDFDKEANGLRSCHAEIFEGLIFISLARGEPADFDSFTTRLRPFLQPYGLRHTKLALRQTFAVRSNWKLIPENTFECYHCPGGHVEYAKVHDLRAQTAIGCDGQAIHAAQKEWETRARAAGFLPDSFEDPSDASHFQAAMRFEVGFGNLTASPDGKPLAPLLTKSVGFDGGWTYIAFNPVTTLLCYSDFVVVLSFVPQGPLQTDYIASWYVAEDAIPKRDYDVEKMTALLGKAMDEDKTLINLNQRGIGSRAYRPGRYSTAEARTVQLLDWYMQHVIAPRGDSATANAAAQFVQKAG